MSQEARYSVGIDLGTTHSVLSYLEFQSEEDKNPSLHVLPLPQLVALGQIEEKSQLPSFMYLAHGAEIGEGTTTLPWADKAEHLIGEIARNLGSKTPIRLVSSAKSWLCHAGVDCKQAILPSEAPEDVTKVSPFLASKAYLQHLNDAWNYRFPQHRLQNQHLTITVPASFDPAARDLTAKQPDLWVWDMAYYWKNRKPPSTVGLKKVKATGATTFPSAISF